MTSAFTSQATTPMPNARRTSAFTIAAVYAHRNAPSLFCVTPNERWAMGVSFRWFFLRNVCFNLDQLQSNTVLLFLFAASRTDEHVDLSIRSAAPAHSAFSFRRSPKMVVALSVLATTAALLGSQFSPQVAPAARCPPPCMANTLRKMKVGLVGGGTVGGGVVSILGKARALQASLGVDVEIATICVRDKSKKRDFVLPAGCKIVEDINEILQDDSIDLVCEVMGGTTIAKDVVMRSIKAGKHVVTANKALIAQELPELEALVQKVGAQPTTLPTRFSGVFCAAPVTPAATATCAGERRARRPRQIWLRGGCVRRHSHHPRAAEGLPR